MGPSRIGRYEIIGPLATGGMAEIHLARLSGPSGFERLVVVKRILPHLASQKSFVGMFLDEARIVSRIHHPNVVQVQELGHEDGELFLVMEYLQGESASSLVKRSIARNEPLEVGIGAVIVAEACAGLHAAHELRDASGVPQSIVHRDVSPQNLVITYDGDVKVLDFGIAKAADRLTRTETGQVKGKFEYMSPEQCVGTDLDRRSDVFSLGVVLYELTTGRRLFKRATQLQTMKAITEESVLKPSRLNPSYPSDLEAVVMRALARKREDRHASAADLRRELLDFLHRARPAGDVREWVGLTMRRLFEDRIEEKRAMISEVRRGSSAHVPTSEVSEPVEELEVPSGEGTEAASLLETRMEVPRPRNGRARTTAIASAAIGVAFATVAIVAARNHAAPGAGSAPASVAPSASAAIGTTVVPAHAPTLTAPETLLHVETLPPGASVVVGNSTLGTTPFDLTLPRSGTPVTLDLKKAGYRTVSQTIVPDVEQRIVVSLDPQSQPRPSHAPPSHTAASQPRPAPSAPATFQRFD